MKAQQVKNKQVKCKNIGKCCTQTGKTDFCTVSLLNLWHAYLNAAAAAKSLQSCPTLCNPIDGSPPGSPVPGILQARILEWVAISFSYAWKWKVKVKSLSRVWLLATPWTAAHQAPPSMDFPGKSTGVGCHCCLRIWMLSIYKCVVVHSISQTGVTETAVFKNMNCAVSYRIVPCFVGIFHVALMVKNPPANADSIPRSGRSSGRGHGNPLQYSCLENPMDRGVWWAAVLGVTKSQTQLKRLSMHAGILNCMLPGG